MDQISPDLENIILNHHLHSQRSYDVQPDRLAMREQGGQVTHNKEQMLEQRRSHSLIKDIHQLLLSSLMSSADHLKNCSEDVEARNEAFWFRGGIAPDKNMIKKREGTQKMQKKLREKGWKYNTGDGLRRMMTDEELHAPYDRAIQYLGRSCKILYNVLTLD